jgi:hypothetical protein
MIRRLLGTLLIIQAFPMVAVAQVADSTTEFWPEFDFYIKLNEKSRLFLMSTATRTENLGAYAEGQAGFHIDFYGLPPLHKRLIDHFDQARTRSLMVRVGYLISRPKNDSGSATEQMAIVEATGRVHLPRKWQVSDRNRLDFRWLDGVPSHRYRNRLKFEKTFDLWKFQLTPYAHAELFYGFDKRKWTRFRYSAGAEWNITKRFVLEGYYLNQNSWNSVPQFVNAIGIALQFYSR